MSKMLSPIQRESASGLDAARHYVLVCSACGRRQDDDGLILHCPEDHPLALLRTDYENRVFKPFTERKGLFRYQNWLPVVGRQEDVGCTVVYRSQRLARELGLGNLWIAFNGYWPERDVTLETATFKELEAYTVLGRLAGNRVVLTVASSGNTGAAFAWACSRRRVPCLIVVPEKSLHRFRFREPLDPCVKLVSVEDGDYPDAMDLAATVSKMPHFQAEGGVKNVGRRDGLATVMLAAFEEMQCLPTHYFQAVGSGTGAIAVLEAARRLLEASGTAAVLPRLMLCQNLPFTPIYEAWRMNRNSLSGSPERFRDAVGRVHADELTNWTPPYEVRGGVYDSLTASAGDVLAAENAAVRIARDMFADLEGIDMEPASGVALACLRDAVAQGTVDAKSTVLLNVTGGGRLRLGKDH
ncbi:MAG: cysteate synthase, partial [Kutzneria sp.]|nr:cysteate synthase [Kutzneria sp.]